LPARWLTHVETTDANVGGNDQIGAGEGGNVVIGGVGRDQNSTTGAGDDVVVGDNGYANFDVVAGASILRKIETTSPDDANDDVIRGERNGADVALGGSGADRIVVGWNGQRPRYQWSVTMARRVLTRRRAG